jgi:hypothetical protein
MPLIILFASNYPGENRSVNSWNFPWNSMKFSMENSMEISMENSIEFHGIPLNFMKVRLIEFHGIQLTEFDGIRF